MVERLAYDPWGKRRNIQSQPGQPDPLDQLVGQHTERGYTEHEHLDEVGVIHMNGRIFDPLMGRFMSADPENQEPLELKSFNRYSYVWNNPLGMTDPTGYFSWNVGGPNDNTNGTGYTYTSSDGSRTTYGCSGCTLDGGAADYSGHSGGGGKTVISGTTTPASSTGTGFRVTWSNVGWSINSAINTGMSWLTGGYSDRANAAYSREDYIGYAGWSLAGIFMGGSNFVTDGAVGLGANIARQGVSKAASVLEVRVADQAAKGATAAETVAARVITETGELRLSASVADKYAATRPYVTPLTVQETIAGGVRAPDPQGVAGRFMYTVDSIYNKSVGKFEVLVNELTNTVEHALFKSGK